MLAGNKSAQKPPIARKPPAAKSWLFLSVIIGLLLGTPLIVVLVKLFAPSSEVWHHIFGNLLIQYTLNSLALCFFTGTIALVIGVGTAWLISRFTFPGKRWLEWALVLPLALPSYIVAYSYAGILSYTGPFYSFIRVAVSESLAQTLYVDTMNLGTLSILLGVSLFPYVYLASKTAFQLQSAAILEAADSLSSKSFVNFYRVALPLARPAIAGGLFLVIMEVLNDYGAVKYYGVNTFTTGIFKAWFSMSDMDAAIKLSAILMLFVGLLFILEKRIQKSTFASNTGLKRAKAKELQGTNKWLVFIICFLPFFVGFTIPFSKILNDTFLTWHKVVDMGIYSTILNSIGLAALASALIVVLSILFIYSVRLNKSIIGKAVKQLVSIGYALPGAVIAVGVMIVFGAADQFLELGLNSFGITLTKLVFSGSLIGLVYAYLIRFMAVSINPLEGNFEQQCTNIDEASRSLGKSNLQTLFKVNIPVLKPAILAASLLVFVDVMKELPLTLILRPFNFDTLATTAFEFANDEMLRESASASLLIVLSGIIPILLIHLLIKKV